MTRELVDDELLFAAACAGDGEAFGVLYGRYFGKAAAKCAPLAGSDASAEDLAQDAFAEAWIRITQGRVTARGEFGAWLLGAVVPYVLTCRRRAWWEQRNAIEGAAHDARGEHVHGRIVPDADAEVCGALAEQLAALTPRQRLSVQLCVLDGRKSRVVAEMTGLSRKTVTNLKAAAVATLRHRMTAPPRTAVAS